MEKIPSEKYSLQSGRRGEGKRSSKSLPSCVIPSKEEEQNSANISNMLSWDCSKRTCLLVLLMVILQVQSQVTFSRDWKAGKRSQSDSECPLILSSATTACQLLVRELRQLDTCELGSFTNYRDGDLNRNSYTEPAGRRR